MKIECFHCAYMALELKSIIQNEAINKNGSHHHN